MGLRSYAYALVVPAGASGRETILTVPDGRAFRLRSVTVAFPVGVEGNLKVRIMSGPFAVVPTEGYLQGDGVAIRVAADHEYSAGSTVDVEYVNSDTVNEHTVYIVLEGDMV